MSRLSEKERAARKASFQEMTLAGKAEYIFEYFKVPIFVGLVVLYFTCYTVYQQVTKKDTVLYSGLINISIGDELASQLNEGFLSASGANPKKTEVYLYSGLYMSNNPSLENYEYQYASNLKLLAAIESKQLDLVLMNREAYDLFSQKGYLMDFHDLLVSDDALYQLLEPRLTENTVILKDNAVEYMLNEAHRYQAVTEEVTNGLDVSALPLFQEAGLSDSIYLGVVGNSPRLPEVIQYIEYLAGVQEAEG